jgi:predicted 3-demethylubiquinone-9 3-methyltransferase (glyoxalase superfamily)
MAVRGAVPYIWFVDGALEAVEFYCSLFPDSRVIDVSYYRDGAPMPAGTVLVVNFELLGRPYAALNGGPAFPQSESFSIQVEADTQQELDRIWDALVADGGAESMCGWCKDRWGVSWQVVPRVLADVYKGPDQAAADRAWVVMMEMGRLDIATIEAAIAAGD